MRDNRAARCFRFPSDTMTSTQPSTVESVVSVPRVFPRSGAPWPQGGEWFARLIGVQLLVVAFAMAGSWSRSLHSSTLPSSMAAEDVPVIDFPAELAGDGPASGGDMVAEVASPVEAVPEPVMPELVEAAPVESPVVESPVPELVEALPAPIERPAIVMEEPAARPRPVATTASTSQAPSTPRPAARPGSAAVGSGAGTASSPVLFGGGGTGRFPLPPYPSEARRRGIEGNVMLRVEVSEGGRPDVPRIESSSGSSSLDRAAVDWIRARWRWDPGPVRHYRIPISYQIR